MRPLLRRADPWSGRCIVLRLVVGEITVGLRAAGLILALFAASTALSTDTVVWEAPRPGDATDPLRGCVQSYRALFDRPLRAGSPFWAGETTRLLPGSEVDLTSASGRRYSFRYLAHATPEEIRRDARDTAYATGQAPRERPFLWVLPPGESRPTKFYLDRLVGGQVVRVPDHTPRTVDFGGRSIHHFGADPAGHVALMRAHGLDFGEPVALREEAGGATYRFSPAFELEGGRVGVYALVELPGQPPVLRLFWRSNSHGIFRVLPGIRAWGKSKAGRYDKGEGELGLAVPWELQERLARMGASPRRIPLDVVERLEEGGAFVHRDEFERDVWTKSLDYVGNQVGVRRLFRNNPLNMSDADLPAPQRVDYTRTLGRFETTDALMGRVEVLAYPSRDGSLVYVFHRTLGEPRLARIAEVQLADSPLTNLGVPRETVDAGPLTSPIWEHRVRFQSFDARGNLVEVPPDGPIHPTAPGYESQWHDVRHLPELQRAYAAWGLTIPESPLPARP